MNTQIAALKKQLEEQILSSSITFNPSIDCRNDLVNFYGYSHQQVSKMSDDEVFHIMDKMEDQEKGYTEPEHILVNIPCNCCKHPQMYEMDFSDWNDKYTLQCPVCNHESEIHYTVYDAILESYQEPVKVDIDTLLIDEIDFSSMTYNCLINAGYKTIKQLKESSLEDMYKIRNLGRKSLNEIEEKLNIKFN